MVKHLEISNNKETILLVGMKREREGHLHKSPVIKLGAGKRALWSQGQPERTTPQPTGS